MRYNRGQKLPGEVLDREEVGALLHYFPETTTGIRDRAIFAVCLYGQLRASEATALRPCDLDLEKCAITVLRGKGGKRRVVGYPREKIHLLEAWLKIRPDSAWLFPSRTGGRLATSHLRRTAKRAGRGAGIDHRVHPHALRHTGACMMADQGLDIRIIQRQLGHSNLAVTDRYLDHLNPRVVVEQVSALTF